MPPKKKKKEQLPCSAPFTTIMCSACDTLLGHIDTDTGVGHHGKCHDKAEHAMLVVKVEELGETLKTVLKQNADLTKENARLKLAVPASSSVQFSSTPTVGDIENVLREVRGQEVGEVLGEAVGSGGSEEGTVGFGDVRMSSGSD